MADDADKSFGMEDALRLKELLEGKGRAAPRKETPLPKTVQATHLSSDEEDLGSWRPFDATNFKRPGSSSSSSGRKGSAPAAAMTSKGSTPLEAPAPQVAQGGRRISENLPPQAPPGGWFGKIGRRASEQTVGGGGSSGSLHVEASQSDVAWARTQAVSCSGYLKKEQRNTFGFTKRYVALTTLVSQ